ncbi:hypothetical protein Q667_17685 [Marinobacter sp. C1S70]|uniref:N-acetylneuraminate synthase family protein n=1 Tax=Marinobacter sp. C1S70 TaxID=1396859 RepID=UPI0003B80859|nr:N-acetylneuraminate synthase family protein [Marinobacter sp. C1S70]ERS85085.1 hypothetical protein Q667_17685 [Marinobacter sp. C1S70]
MIIERNITPYTVFADDEISIALQKISANKSGFVFVVASNGVLEGILTDGDFRRWLLRTENFDLTQPVSVAANCNFIHAAETSSNSKLEELLSSRVKYLPLLDSNQRLVAMALHEKASIEIDNFCIHELSKTFIIAEIGNNHNGDILLAKRLVDEAVKAGADCAKFQLRDMESVYRNASDDGEDLGAEYTLDLLNRFQLSKHEMFQIFDYCKEKGILPLCTPWDESSLERLESYGMSAYKVASADLTNHDLLQKLTGTGKPLICSTGMSTEREVKTAIDLLDRSGCQYILLHCNSTYPAPFKDINLRYLERLKELSSSGIVGYSGHERGSAIAIAAVALGAKVIEKHFTLDRSMEGNDHRVSLLPDEFRLMVEGIREVEQALGKKSERYVTQGEMMNREVLGKSIVAKRRISKGSIITDMDIEVRSPGKGIPPYRKNELIGKPSDRNIEKGDFFYVSDLRKTKIEPRNYSFSHPFGIPVRYHDFKNLVPLSNLDLVEFHLSYRDLELSPSDYLDPNGYELDLIVHSPELFSGDHILDLSSPDFKYRNRSIDELQRVIEVTRKLEPYFNTKHDTLIIVNAGGFTQNGFIAKALRSEFYERVANSLSKLDAKGTEIIIQTMPPFPWHFGGQSFHNLFMEPDEIVEFCKKYNYRICLDTSHSKLLCNHIKMDFSRFIKMVSPFTAHLHIVDAKGTDEEGLQIEEGELDFSSLARNLNKFCPNASFIPEIWQGHKNSGEGFWVALERLESFNI